MVYGVIYLKTLLRFSGNMIMRFNTGCYLLLLIIFSCGPRDNNNIIITTNGSRSVSQITSINTGKTTPSQLITFAQSLTGIPYKYGSIDPKQGFDCSGFITYVFNHFNITVPRISIDFTFVERAIDLKQAKPGDLILFTGTDSTIRKVGHIGIIVSSPGEEVKFIHATSGKAYSVTTTPLNNYYRGRYIKVVRVFKHNDE